MRIAWETVDDEFSTLNRKMSPLNRDKNEFH